MSEQLEKKKAGRPKLYGEETRSLFKKVPKSKYDYLMFILEKELKNFETKIIKN